MLIITVYGYNYFVARKTYWVTPDDDVNGSGSRWLFILHITFLENVYRHAISK